MHEEPSEDLLVIIAMQEDDPEAARQAFIEFHRRFKGHVWNIADKLSRSISAQNQDLVAQDIFNDTFLSVYTNYQSKAYFDPVKVQDIEKGIKAWLSGIAKNHLKRMIDAGKKFPSASYFEVPPDYLFFDPEEEEEEEVVNSPTLAALKHVLDVVLNEKERWVLLTSFQFEEEGKLPDEIRRSLCEDCCVLPVTLRQIKKRAKDKIEKYFREHGYLTSTKSQTNVK